MDSKVVNAWKPKPGELNRQDARLAKRTRRVGGVRNPREFSLDSSLFFPLCDLGVLAVQFFG
jgi:hypothetical protein